MRLGTHYLGAHSRRVAVEGQTRGAGSREDHHLSLLRFIGCIDIDSVWQNLSRHVPSQSHRGTESYAPWSSYDYSSRKRHSCIFTAATRSE